MNRDCLALFSLLFHSFLVLFPSYFPLLIIFLLFPSSFLSLYSFIISCFLLFYSFFLSSSFYYSFQHSLFFLYNSLFLLIFPFFPLLCFVPLPFILPLCEITRLSSFTFNIFFFNFFIVTFFSYFLIYLFSFIFHHFPL